MSKLHAEQNSSQHRHRLRNVHRRENSIVTGLEDEKRQSNFLQIRGTGVGGVDQVYLGTVRAGKVGDCWKMLISK
jgi:hypothetical protein